MSHFVPSNDPSKEGVEDQAASWVLRRDRGLSAEEQDAFSQWLGADPRHGAALARHRRNWDRLDHLAEWRPRNGPRPNPDLLAPRAPAVRSVNGVRMAVLAAAAVVLLIAGGWWVRHPARPASQASTPLPPIEQRVLEDGSTVELNRGAQVAVSFTGIERRVTLEQGEAHFTVTKNPERPFVVTASGVEVIAVGTAFNVRIVDSRAVEVVVTEGRVRVNEHGGPTPEDPASARSSDTGTMVDAGQRARVEREAGAMPAAVASHRVAPLTSAEMEELLAWQPRMLDFTAAPLSSIVAEFNRRNPVQLVVGDPELLAIKISATFRSDNLEGFVRLLEASFGIRIDRSGTVITLHKSVVR